MKFEITLPMLLQYLAWRNTQHTPLIVLQIFGLIKSMDSAHIIRALTEAPNMVPFTQNLRQNGYSWITAMESTIIFNLAVIQNRYPAGTTLIFQLDKDYEDIDFSSNFPEVFKFARGRKEVATPNLLLIKTAKAAKAAQRRRDKGVHIQGEPLSELLSGGGPDYPY